jgi:hypothetical protein
MGLRFSCVARGWGGSWKLAVALLGVRTAPKNPLPISWYKHTSLAFVIGVS